MLNLKNPSNMEKISKLNPNFAYGLSGLSELLGVSKPTAVKIKGQLSGCYAQSKNVTIYDVKKVLNRLGMTQTEGGAE
jgi:hypothetical protein